ncbi:deoxyribonuclease IV [Paenibacillus sp. IHBB 10380]|uniref:deoxyribonuclease IV n=1 Tax=Paenibacillus sp. IHBB 10380 TaxID=1566358 RepID=UPI0005CFAB01|nr:deoxyribonuclease IV [Paenibacillus sp. IHBB 10380]AJS58325.1 endonuclease IV [Paenibacillus sp. IHBB 10380]
MINEIKIGSHMSIRGGYGRAARRAVDMGAKSFQYFPKNPRSLHIKTLNSRDAADCAMYSQENGILSIAHTPYPVNMAIGQSRGIELYNLTVSSLQNDLDIAEACGSLGIVVHFGHYKGTDPLQGYKNIIECLNDVLSSWEGNTKLLIENQAGHGGIMGTTLEEMVNIRGLSRYSDKIGFCFDTCHAFAAGVWDPSNTRALIEKGRQLEYWKDVVAIHLNDSKFPFGSGQDRHARVGEGCIGEEAFRQLFSYPEFQYTVAIMETEAGEDGTHKEDIAKIMKWS